MFLFDWFKQKKKTPEVEGSLSYIPGSQTPNQDEPIYMEHGALVKRYVRSTRGTLGTGSLQY